MQLHWYKNRDGDWCRLEETEHASVEQYGVFIVWRSGDSGRPSAVLYVGRGSLRQEISQFRRGPAIVGSRDLRITWAKVDPRDVDGVAAYLYQQLRPLWGEVLSEVPAQPVNLPLTA